MLGKITVKNVRVIEAVSQETLCFRASIYENGVCIGHAENNGQGAPTFVHLRKPNSKTEGELSELEVLVDDLVYELYNEKQKDKIYKRLKRDCINHICIGSIQDNIVSYTMQGFVSKKPLSVIAKQPKGLEAIQKLVDRLKKEAKPNEVILNDNLQAIGVQI